MPVIANNVGDLQQFCVQCCREIRLREYSGLPHLQRRCWFLSSSRQQTGGAWRGNMKAGSCLFSGGVAANCILREDKGNMPISLGVLNDFDFDSQGLAQVRSGRRLIRAAPRTQCGQSAQVSSV